MPGQTWHVSSAGSTGAAVFLKANIHFFEPSEVCNVSTGNHKFKDVKFKDKFKTLKGDIFHCFTLGWNKWN